MSREDIYMFDEPVTMYYKKMGSVKREICFYHHNLIYGFNAFVLQRCAQEIKTASKACLGKLSLKVLNY